jgi:hypothetical protein
MRDAAEASLVVQESFLALAAADWQPDARRSFLEFTAPELLQNRLSAMTFAACAFSGKSAKRGPGCGVFALSDTVLRR